MYIGGNFLKQKHTFMSPENSGQQTYDVDLRWPVLKVLTLSLLEWVFVITINILCFQQTCLGKCF